MRRAGDRASGNCQLDGGDLRTCITFIPFRTRGSRRTGIAFRALCACIAFRALCACIAFIPFRASSSLRSRRPFDSGEGESKSTFLLRAAQSDSAFGVLEVVLSTVAVALEIVAAAPAGPVAPVSPLSPLGPCTPGAPASSPLLNAARSFLIPV